MLVNLTPNKEGIKKLYQQTVQFYKNEHKHFTHTFANFYEKFTCLNGEPGFYLENDHGSPHIFLKDWYDEYTREVEYDDEFLALRKANFQLSHYGIADSLDQIKDYYKACIDDPNTKWAIFAYAIWHHPENAGQEGGYRPYKSGPYIGKYEQIDDCEYYDDCEFEEGYQGYLIHFHILPVV